MAKKFAFIMLFASLAWLQISKFEIPGAVEEKALYTGFKILTSGMSFISSTAEKLNYGYDAANFRFLLNGFATLAKIDNKEVSNVKFTDRKINGVNCRVYRQSSPVNVKNLPILVFYHGGAYYMGSVGVYHEYLSELSSRLNAVLISVDYRLAPEHPFPAPTDDCYAVTKYVLESKDEFGDTNKVILAGDSAGGNAAAVITQRLKSENKKMPKLQVLVYPWTQMFNMRLPSIQKHARSGMIELTFGKYLSWYLGFNPATEELQSFFENNNHTLAIKDKKEFEKFKSYTDPNLIPQKYKNSKKYYNSYDLTRNEIFPKSQHSQIILKVDKKLANAVSNLFSPKMSPGLAEPEKLIGLPRTLFVMCEVDPVKDEGLIYSERLKTAGVKVDVHFYECFHGAATLVDKTIGFSIARTMLDNMVDYINNSI